MQGYSYRRYVTRAALASAGACVLLLSGCNYFATIGGPVNTQHGVDHVDPDLNLTREDYRHLNAPKMSDEAAQVTVEKGAPPIPKLADILAAPRPPKIGETQLVSIAVTDDVPLKDVLLELAKLADVDIELDASITGGIEFIAKDKPFNEVIDRICELAGLRYTMKNNILRVERDTPYIKSYSVDFLNLDRDSDSSVSLSTNVLSAGGGSGGGGGASGGLNTGSTSTVKSTTKGDFWKSLENGVEQVLAYQPSNKLSATTMQAESDGNVLGAAAATGPAPAPGSPEAAAAAAKPGAAAAPTPAARDENKNNISNGIAANKTAYTINRQAGVLTVNATDHQHELVRLLLEKLQSNASAQVLIEAKIIEVDLSEQYQSGINWTVLASRFPGLNGLSIAGAFNGAGDATALSAGTNAVTFTADNGKDILNLIEQFGTIRTLSSPRLHAINNQQSTMTFAKNLVYFQVTATQPTTTTTGTVSTTPTAPTINSTVQTVPIGVMMTMMPSIDIENNEVTLAVRPTLSSVIDFKSDPSTAYIVAQACAAYVNTVCPLAGFSNEIPEIQVRELDSTLKLKSGQTMVIGGLMQQGANNTDTGLPFFSSIPVIGNAFKGVNKTNSKSELVLLLKATIVNTGGSLNKTDKDIFHKFSDDPRPVSF